jgi:hypothetical protein
MLSKWQARKILINNTYDDLAYLRGVAIRTPPRRTCRGDRRQDLAPGGCYADATLFVFDSHAETE